MTIKGLLHFQQGNNAMTQHELMGFISYFQPLHINSHCCVVILNKLFILHLIVKCTAVFMLGNDDINWLFLKYKMLFNVFNLRSEITNAWNTSGVF